jgi:hypothetical protein
MKPLEIAGFINKQLSFLELSSAVKPDSSSKGSAGKKAAKKRGEKANGCFFIIL